MSASHPSPLLVLVLILTVLPFMAMACSRVSEHVSPSEPPPEPPLAAPDTLKVLTYNTLHGLAVGRFWVHTGETAAQHRARFDVQVRQLAQVQPDVVLLQEVNPLPSRAEEYVMALQAAGLQYTQVHQVDNCGLRVGPLGLIPVLNNGLVILAKRELRLKKLAGVKLSGAGRCSDRFGVQLNELRYGLIAEVQIGTPVKKFLIANVHLHSGIEGDTYLLKALAESHARGRLHHYEHLKAELMSDQTERLAEIKMLLEELKRLGQHHDHTALVGGGDFNFESEAPEYRGLAKFGLTDSYQTAMHNVDVYSYDPDRDKLAAEDVKAVPDDLKTAIAAESLEDQKEILAEYGKDIRRHRRIDFLFGLSTVPFPCHSQKLFGLQKTSAGIPGSDHYGVLNTYYFRNSACHKN